MKIAQGKRSAAVLRSLAWSDFRPRRRGSAIEAKIEDRELRREARNKFRRMAPNNWSTARMDPRQSGGRQPKSIRGSRTATAVRGATWLLAQPEELLSCCDWHAEGIATVYGRRSREVGGPTL